MIVYHGSSGVVRQPDILHSYRALDFGKGFFITQRAIDKLLRFDGHLEV